MPSSLPQVKSADPKSPRLLPQWEPWHRVFTRNLRDLFLEPGPRLPIVGMRSGTLWSGVFVETRLPAGIFLRSAVWHGVAIALIYALSITAHPEPLTPIPRSQTITYYNVSEYLPPLDTGSPPAPVARKGEPRLARQRIISLPRRPDNFRQTIVDPSSAATLIHDQPLPNLVAWGPDAAPVQVFSGHHAAIVLPRELEIVQPPPDINTQRNMAQLRVDAPPTEIVGPPPDPGKRNLARLNVPNITPGVVEPPVTVNAQRRLGDMNMAAAATVASPKITLAEQRSSGAPPTDAAGAQSANAPAAQNNVPPPPSIVSGGSGPQASGRLIALGLDPTAINGPITAPGGNRRGQFAATPEGKIDAPGTPDIAAGGTGSGGRGSGNEGAGDGNKSDLPAGLTVEGGPHAPSTTVAAPAPSEHAPVRSFPSVAASHTTDLPKPTLVPPSESSIEQQVFGSKRFYQMAINMPNFTSGGGSWIVRFAELNESRAAAQGDLSAPVALLKVDPAYPPEAMRDRVEGTVTLYAVIRSDGSVGEVRVLQGVDERLDRNATKALERWQFRPATKNGLAVALEAVVQIPFKIGRIRF